MSCGCSLDLNFAGNSEPSISGFLRGLYWSSLYRRHAFIAVLADSSITERLRLSCVWWPVTQFSSSSDVPISSPYCSSSIMRSWLAFAITVQWLFCDVSLYVQRISVAYINVVLLTTVDCGVISLFGHKMVLHFLLILLVTSAGMTRGLNNGVAKLPSMHLHSRLNNSTNGTS